MMIESYSFGKIIIDGKTYNSDLIIFPDKIDDNWWREKSHNLSIADLQKILRSATAKIIIGTGAYGLMKVADETKDFLSNKNIAFQIEKTPKAVELYNSNEDKTGVVLALHLTC